MNRQEIEAIGTPQALLAYCGNDWARVEALLAHLAGQRESWAKFSLKAMEALVSEGFGRVPDEAKMLLEYSAAVPRLAAIAARKCGLGMLPSSMAAAVAAPAEEAEEFGEKVAERWQPSEREGGHLQVYKPYSSGTKAKAAAHGAATATPANTIAKSKPLSTSREVGNFDRLVEALPKDATPAQKKEYAEKALFKIRLQYYPQGNDPRTGQPYNRGFEANSYGRDRVSEQTMFADDANVRRVKAMLEKGTNVADIFGDGGFLAAKAFNAWKYNLGEIEKIAKEGHPSWGRLQSAHIFFQPVKNAQGWPVEIFRYEDQ